MIKQLWDKYGHEAKHFLLYAVIGCAGVSLDFLLYWFLVSAGLNLLVANVISTTCAILLNFGLNIRYNFKGLTMLRLRLVSFFAVGIVGLLVSTLILHVATESFGVGPLPAKVLTLFVVLVLQYGLNRIFTFGDIVHWKRAAVRNWGLVVALLALVISLVLSVFALPSSDEYDNMLGAQHIVDYGSWPYSGFFSHHMPLPYIIGTIFYLIGRHDAVAFRLAFYGFVAAILLVNALIISRVWSRVGAVAFLWLVTIGVLFIGLNRYLSENLAILFFITAINLLVARMRGVRLLPPLVGTLLVSLLLILTAFTTLNYVYVIAIVYLFLFVQIIRETRWRLGTRAVWGVFSQLAMLAIPPIAALLIILATGVLPEFLKQAVEFNTKYYSQFGLSLGNNVVDTFLSSLAVNTDAYLTAVSDVFGKAAMIPFVGLVSIFMLVCLGLRKYALVGILFLSMLFVSNTRSAVGLEEPAVYHFALMKMLTILVLSYVLGIIWVGRDQIFNVTRRLGILIAVAAMLVVWGTGRYAFTSLQYASHVFATYVTKSEMTLKGTEHNAMVQAHDLTKVVETDPRHGGYFVGPLSFDVQTKMTTKQATSHTFWLPWVASCDECREQLLQQLNAEQPSAIIWNEQYTIGRFKLNDYNQEFNTFLESHYTKVRNYGPVVNLYVRNDLSGQHAGGF